MTEQEKVRKWAEAWKIAGAEMERIRNEDIRAFVLERDWKIAGALFDLGTSQGIQSDSSGLVEQQRLFTKIHQQKKTS